MIRYELERDLAAVPWCAKTYQPKPIDTHFHYSMELIYVAGKSLSVTVGKRLMKLVTGEYILINSGVPHATENPDNGCYYLCSIPKSALMPMTCRLIDDFYLRKDDKDRTMYYLLKCFDLRGRNWFGDFEAECDKNFLISAANAVISYFAAGSGEEAIYHKRDDPFCSMIAYICENYRDPRLNSQSLARRFGYTPGMMSDMFNDNIKLGVKKYIDILRVNDAKFQLTSTQDSIDVIAERSGFDSVRSFYRVFAKQTGMTPGEYRKATPTKT